MALQPHRRARPRRFTPGAVATTVEHGDLGRAVGPPGRRRRRPASGDLPESRRRPRWLHHAPGGRPDRRRRARRRHRGRHRSSSATRARPTGVAAAPQLVVRAGSRQRGPRRRGVRGRRRRAAAARAPRIVARPARPASGYVGVQRLDRAAWSIGTLDIEAEAQASVTAGLAGFGGDYARVRTDCRLVGRGATGRPARRLLRRRRPDARLPHLPGPRGARHHQQPALQGRGERPVPLRVHRPDPGGEGRPRAPTPSRPTATSSSPRRRGPSRCPTSRSRTTTCTAATPRPSGPIDEEQRFYLESRGVPTRVAERLIVAGFFAEVFDRLPGRRPAPAARRRRRRQAHGGAGMTRRSSASGRWPTSPDGQGPAGGDRRPRRSPSCASATTCTPSATAAATRTSRSSEGDVDCDEKLIECWKHGSAFSLETGEPESLPATKPVPVVRGAGRRRRRSRWWCRDRARARDRRACGPAWPARRSSRASTSPSARGEVHAIMGPNGSGKSTLSHVIMGRPGYEVLGGTVTLDGVDLLGLAAVGAGPGRACSSPCSTPPRCRAWPSSTCSRRPSPASAATPPTVPARIIAEAERIGFDDRFLHRAMNVDLSGGEKKRNETLQLGVLEPAIAILDELDSGPRRRRPARLRPPHRGRHRGDRPRRARHHALQPAAPRAARRPRPRARRRARSSAAAAPSWPSSWRPPATPAGSPRSRRPAATRRPLRRPVRLTAATRRRAP